MRAAVLIIGLLVGAVVLVVVAADYWLLQEEGVITLWTADAEGQRLETQVWAVDGPEVDGGGADTLWLSAHSPRAWWLARLRARPEVEIQHGRDLVPYRATVPAGDPALRRELQDAMAAKYGLAHHVVSAIFGANRAVPVRLDPDPTREPERANGGAHGAPSH